MHPQIVSDRPGSCPICGMALDPRTVSPEAEVNPELASMNRGFLVSAVLTIPLVLIMAIPGLSRAHPVSAAAINWLELVLSTPVVLRGGWPFFVRGWVDRKPQPEHVYAYRPRCFRCLYLQRHCRAFSRHLSPLVQVRRRNRHLFRSGRSHYDPGPARTGAPLGVPIAAGVLYPFLGILLSPILAAAAMGFSSVSVIGNALRLRTANI